MSIEALTSKYYPFSQELKPSQANVGSDFKQCLDLVAGKEIDLGSIDDKPMKMRIFDQGGFEWSGSWQLHADGRAGTKITDYEWAAARAYDSYTRPEHKYVEQIMSVVNDMYLLSKGKINIEAVNAGIKGRGISAQEVQEALQRLGFNPNQPFKVNGIALEYSDGAFKENGSL